MGKARLEAIARECRVQSIRMLAPAGIALSVRRFLGS